MQKGKRRTLLETIQNDRLPIVVLGGRRRRLEEPKSYARGKRKGKGKELDRNNKWAISRETVVAAISEMAFTQSPLHNLHTWRCIVPELPPTTDSDHLCWTDWRVFYNCTVNRISQCSSAYGVRGKYPRQRHARPVGDGNRRRTPPFPSFSPQPALRFAHCGLADGRASSPDLRADKRGRRVGHSEYTVQ